MTLLYIIVFRVISPFDFVIVFLYTLATKTLSLFHFNLVRNLEYVFASIVYSMQLRIYVYINVQKTNCLCVWGDFGELYI